jgi:hypothetical protein
LLVGDDRDIHSVDAGVFPATYRQIHPGAYVKATPVWAEVARIIANMGWPSTSRWDSDEPEWQKRVQCHASEALDAVSVGGFLVGMR